MWKRVTRQFAQICDEAPASKQQRPAAPASVNKLRQNVQFNVRKPLDVTFYCRCTGLLAPPCGRSLYCTTGVEYCVYDAISLFYIYIYTQSIFKSLIFWNTILEFDLLLYSWQRPSCVVARSTNDTNNKPRGSVWSVWCELDVSSSQILWSTVKPVCLYVPCVFISTEQRRCGGENLTSSSSLSAVKPRPTVCFIPVKMEPLSITPQ